MLQGKTVLITGASSGIGQACAERFAESGARLLLLARRRERLEQLAAQLQQRYGLDTNIRGLLNVTRVVLPGMVARRSGMVINIGSIAGREVYPNGNVYCATKHAVRALSEALRIDLNGTGIRVVNIDPGLVETEFSLVRFRGDADRARKVYEGLQPLSAADVADVVLFCATRPPHVVIADVLILPSAQANTWLVHRERS